ncbi:MAG: signal peptidase II [Candidatus Latescibacterota bacterium]|nr:signal peptidase II [Candidatus Latescibacterota bacterium]
MPATGTQLLTLRSCRILLWAPLVLVLDQWTKYIVVQHLPRNMPQPVLGNYLRLTYIHNSGAAFGFDLGSGLVHTVVAIAALGILGWVFISLRSSSRLQRTALAMVLGGALGNIVDRLRMGEVVDFVDVGVSAAWRWPVFNVADSFITVGVIVLALSYARDRETPTDEAPDISPSTTP